MPSSPHDQLRTEPNRRLRRAREALPSRLAPGEPLSRAELADEVNRYLWTTTGKRYELDGHHIAKWERGAVRWPTPAYRAALRAVLGVDTDLALGFRPSRGVPRSSPAAAEVGMPPTTVDAIKVVSQSFQAADRRVGGGNLYATVKHYFDVTIAPQLHDGRADAKLLSAAASMLEIAGWMAHDSGYDTAAREHFLTSYRLASAGSNHALLANVCASLSHLSTTLHQAKAAESFAVDGLTHTMNTEGTASLVARLHALRARALAELGDAAGSRKELDIAASGVTEQEHRCEWIPSFDQAALASEATACWRSLGEAELAERSAREAIALRPHDRVRSKALSMLALARLLCESGRYEEAARLGTAVITGSDMLRSARVQRELDELTTALRPQHALSEVEEYFTTRSRYRSPSTVER